MQVIRHQAIRRAYKFFPNTGMQQNLSELKVKTVVQPAGSSLLDAHGPVNSSEALIVRALQSGEVMEVWITHGSEIIPQSMKSQPRSHERSHKLFTAHQR